MTLRIMFCALLMSNLSSAQLQLPFERSEACNVNVNANQFDALSDISKRATFKLEFIEIGGGRNRCTGTLINRDISQDNLDFYFIIARHCVVDIDFGQTHSFIFNYQSRDANNAIVPQTNRGSNVDFNPVQATSTNNANDLNRYHYVHNSIMSLVAWYWWGDFALCKINTPVPPHFNYTFSGWSTSMFSFGNSPPPPFHYVNIHHPRGDIKKISGSTYVLEGVNYGCRTVTKVLDFLFGWIWGRKWSIEVICNYVEVPWAYVPVLNYGISEGGSSGSGLFKNNNLIGILSGSISNCNFRSSTTFGKFRSNYYNKTVKNTLNPEDKYWTDQSGISTRIITCHQSLNNLSGQYFAANAYQADNRITLQSATTVATNGDLRIHPGADYSFVAGQSITFGPGFQVVPPAAGEAMGVFEARIATCVVPRADKNNGETPSKIMYRANQMQLPEFKQFDPVAFLKNDQSTSDLDAQSNIQVFPNPSSDGNFTVRFIEDTKRDVTLSFTDVLGEVLFSLNTSCIQGENYFSLDMSERGVAAGIYFIALENGVSKKVKKVVIR